MATVTRGAVTTQTNDAVSHRVGKLTVSIQDKVDAENAVEKPVVYRSNVGADAAFLRSPEPIYGHDGRQIGMDQGIRLEFTNGLSAPFYPSNPIHAKLVNEIDKLIGENWPIVHDLGLEKVEAGKPQPPLVKWLHLGPETIVAALEANFTDDVDKNVGVIEQGVRFELSRPKKDQRKDLIQCLEALRLKETAVAANADTLDV